MIEIVAPAAAPLADKLGAILARRRSVPPEVACRARDILDAVRERGDAARRLRHALGED